MLLDCIESEMRFRIWIYAYCAKDYLWDIKNKSGEKNRNQTMSTTLPPPPSPQYPTMRSNLGKLSPNESMSEVLVK